MRAFTGAVLLAATVALAGCTAQTGIDGGDGNAVTMTITLDKESFRVGERLKVTATAENRGDESYDYKHRGCPPEPIDIVAVVGGTEVRLYEYGAEGMAGICAIQDVSMEPGDAFTQVGNWNGRTEMGADGGPHSGTAVEPGEYTIIARLSTVDGTAPYRVTAQATVTVTA